MTSKERWIAALKLQPVDRLPFWPKLDAAYPRAQSAPFRSMSIDELHEWIGSDKHVWLPRILKRTGSHSSMEVHQENGTQRTVFTTGSLSTERVNQWDEASQAWHPIVFPIKNLDDIGLMADWFRDSRAEPDEEGLAKARAIVEQTGDDGITTNAIGESPLMIFVEWLAGIENAHYLLADYTAEVEELFDAIQKSNVQSVEMHVRHSPADLLYFIENTSTTLISPKQYRKYCYNHVQEYGRIIDDSDHFFALHMCGHLKALLPDLATIHADAFEAFTSAPVGNTSLLDGRSVCPDKCLIGGTNAIMWVRPADQIISEIKNDLDALPHHRGVAVTSAGVMPPLCTPETIKEVADWVKRYACN